MTIGMAHPTVVKMTETKKKNLFLFQFYGVSYRNKVSHVSTITKETALDFVADDEVQQ